MSIIIKSKESTKHELQKNIVKYSIYLNNLLSCKEFSNEKQTQIELYNINDEVINKIILFLDYYDKKPYSQLPKPLTTNDLSKFVDDWYINFLEMNFELFIQLINSANFLEIDSIIQICCAKIAILLKEKKQDEIQDLLNVKNDF